MKIYIILSSIIALMLGSCQSLDLNPLGEASSGNWYSNLEEIEMSLNDLHRTDFWPVDSDAWTDDESTRSTRSAFVAATLNSEDGTVAGVWKNQYKLIARANNVINCKEGALEAGIDPISLGQYVAEAYFQRAVAYSRLVTKFGDVPYLTEVVDIDAGLKMGRTPKAEVIVNTYADFDKAIAELPVSYSGLQRITKGAAIAFKARFALYIGDWEEVAKSSKACMDLNIYSLHNDYGNLFVSSTKTSPEIIHAIPRSIELGGAFSTITQIIRLRGGWGMNNPSWDLLASYTCTDGLPIDESSLFNSKEPFKNRDPRLSETIIPFGSVILQADYQPHPDSLTIMDYSKGMRVTNLDTRGNQQHAAYNALMRKKGVDDSWMENGLKADNSIIHMRYADVLLMYAESKIEMGEIDQSVLDAINTVRARAYGVSKDAITSYPAVTETDQTKLRKILRMERRSELAWEGLRYMDLIRWRHSEIVCTKSAYGIIYPTDKIDRDSWFWPVTPEIDENGIPDLSNIEATGKVFVLYTRDWNDRQYLWPIPSKEILINKNMVQNPEY